MTGFFEPLQHVFMRDALLVGTLVATMCAVLSCFLILKGWSLMGDAISHAVLPGIVLAYIAGLPLSLGAFVAGLFCAVSTGFIKQHSRIKEDTVMGVVSVKDIWAQSTEGRGPDLTAVLRPPLCVPVMQ